MKGANEADIESQQAIASNPATSDEARATALEKINQLTLQQITLQAQLQKAEQEAGSFQERFYLNWQQDLLKVQNQWGNLALSFSNSGFNLAQQAVSGISNALTGMIIGTKSASAAFAQLGMSLLENFISTILEAVIYAEIALPILTALGVVTGGATAASGASVTIAAIAAGLGAITGLESGGPYTAGSVYVVGERGRELMVPNHNGRVIPNRDTEALLAGQRGSSGGGDGGSGAGRTPVNLHFYDSRPHPRDYLNSSEGENHVVNIANKNRLKIGIQT